MPFQRLLPILVYLAGLSVFTSWKPWQPLTLFQGRPVFFALGFLIAFVAARKWMPSVLAWLERRPAWQYLLPASLMVFITSLVISQTPTRLLQYYPDETCYSLMGRMFSEGHLSLPAHEFPAFFQHIFQVMDDRWYTLFQPGFPMILAVGEWLGVETLINPLLMVACIWLVYLVALEIFDKPTAILSALFLAFSPMSVAMAAMMLNHCLSMMMGLFTVLCVVRIRQRKQRYLYPLLGVCLGFFFWVRGLTAVGFGIPVAFWMLYLVTKKEISFAWALSAVPIGLLFVGLHLGYNAHLTGDALTFPQDHYFEITESKPHCHDLGFGEGIGCSFGPKKYFKNGYWPSDILDVYNVRMPEYLLYALSFVPVLYFFGISFWRKRQRDTKWFLLSIQLSLILIYGLFFFHGGAGRYYLEGLPYLLILIVRGLLVTAGARHPNAEGEQGLPQATLRYLPASVIMGYFVFNGFFMIPAVDQMLRTEKLKGAERIFDHANVVEPNSIVFVTRDYHTVQLLNQGTDQHDSKPLFARDRGSYNSMLMRLHPGRSFYRFDQANPTFVPISDPFPESVLHIEVEVLPPVAYSSGEWAHAEATRPKKFGEEEVIGPDAVLSFEAEKPGSFLGFRQTVFNAGTYTLEAVFQSGQDHGQWLVEVDGVALKPVFDGYSDTLIRAQWKAEEPLALSEGVHVISVRVVGKNPKSSGYKVAIDNLRLTRVER